MKETIKGMHFSLLATILLGLPAAAEADPAVVLNEVMFDAPGPAGADGSWQWVELAVLQDTQFDSSWTLHNEQGAVLCNLPDVTLQAGSFLLAMFGPADASITNLDADSGPIVFTSAQAWGDHLGVTTGGVQLQQGGQVRDEIYWGNSSRQPLFELSLATEHLLEEGESIGRDHTSAYTGSAGDWAIAGGANANGMTPSMRNIVEFPEEKDLVLFQDTVINSVLLGLSLSFTDPGWLRVTETTPTVSSYFASPASDLASIVVDHSFQIVVDGVTHTLSGEVGTTFRRTTGAFATSERYLTTGVLTSGDGTYSLSLSLSEEYTGAHANSRTFAYSTDYTWGSLGVYYPVSVDGAITTTWHSNTLQSSVDDRQGQDFGGAGVKTASGVLIRTRVGDGRFNVESTVTRSYPSLLPKPGEDQSWAGGQEEVLYLDLSFVRDAFGGASLATVTRYEQYLDGSLWAQLQDQKVGTMSFDQTPVSAQVTLFDFEMTLPLQRGDGASFDHRLVVNATHTETREKEVTQFTLRNLSGNWMPWELEGAVDPPSSAAQVAGCALCAAATRERKEKADAEKKKEKKRLWKKVKAAAATTVTCVGAGYLATLSLGTPAGKKAATSLVVKGLGKKMIPGVGWILMGGCALWAIGDWNVGDK